MMGPSRCRFSLYGVVYATLFFTIDAYLNPQILGPSEQPEAYFNGSSYLRLQTPISLRRLVGLSFRTCTGGDLFSQQHSENIIQLSVNSEGVVFFAKTARQQHIEEKIKGNFVDNKWHTVSFHYRLGNLTIYVDKHVKLLANSTFRRTLLSPGLYNEGAVLIVGNHYIGCMLEGPSIVFNESLIQNHNVQFRSCPIADDDCLPSHDHYVPGAPRRNPLPPTTDYCINEPCMRHGKCINTETTYTCECTARYTGKNCEIDQGSPCARDPCLNDARCVEDADGDYRCVCRAGYTGAICEREINLHPLCVGVACHNGGSCQVSGGQVECVCADGYTGAMCETEVDECVGYPCKHSGVCIDGVNNYTCDCTGTGYTGRNCEVNVNECLKTPCLNRGVCFDTYGGYLCQCLAGFDGVNCELNVNECMSQPCLNNGLCVNDVSGYRCKCPQGFTGFHCEIEPRQQQQQQQPLPPVTTCDDCPPYTDCTEDLQCICKPEHPGEYPNCSGIGQCPVNPCKNGGKCFQWNGGINCTCPKGFTGAQCQINENDCASRPCLNDGVCIDKVNGFYCNCTEQWMGTICETPYDACKFKPCQNNATCVTGTNKHEFVCNCPPGFAGDRCQMNLDDCVGVTCPPGKVCVDLVSRYECRCPPGYSGDNCTVDTDACLRKPCKNGATCTTDPITLDFQCICPTGWQGETCDEDVNECDQPGIPICNQGVCMNRNGSFQCYCLPGYTGERCNLDFDECLSQPCKHNATCVNKVNNYECVCPPGFAGKDCHIDINECEPMPCTAGSTCIDGINEFTCLCQPGLTGKLCSVNIDDCMSSPCLNGAQCIDGLNSYYCNCTDTGYTGSHCEINIDECSSSPCVNGAECIDDVKDYRCNCYPGYTGKNCEEDINECESDPCKYSGTCLEKSNLTLYHIGGVSDVDVTLPDVFRKDFDYSEAAGYECLCIPGITGKNCEIDINECDSSPCLSGFCKDAVGGYTCECDNGYEGAHCEIDIDECEKYTPCVHGTCYDGRANYECHCDALYGGKNCSVELIGCKDDPCLNNGVCKPYLVRENDHRFNCSCPNGFHGDTCEGVTTMSLSGRSSVTVNTTREEGYDIQFRFKTTLGDGILALGRGVTYYILELSRGRLNLHTSLLNKWEGVFIGSNLHDSKWQKVFVAINSSHLVLSANDEQTIYPITFNENFNVSSTSFPTTYIGGIPSNVNLRKLTHGQPFLVGCAEDVLINGEWVLPETRNASWLEFQDVEVGCHRIPQCNPNPCHSGGHCTDKWRDFSCTCERPYLGRTCQYNFTAATFGYENITDSLVTVIVADAARRAVRSIVDISMFIRTRQPRGQIFYLGSSTTSSDSTFISAELEAGELLMRVLFNGTTEAYTVGGVKLDNGYNHLIQVIRNVTLVQVKLNGTEYFRKTISATGSLDAQVMYLGGEPQTRSVRQTAENVTPRIDVTPTGPSAAMSSLQNVHFKGIIQDVQISNGSKVMVVEFFPLKIPELNIPMSFGNVSFDKFLVLEGVRSDNSCRVNPCNHNGKCINTWNDYRCECTRGFKGKDCTEQEFCELERCPPSSECKNLDDGYECVANATFDGKSPPLMYSHTVLNQQIGEQFSFTSLELNYRTRSWGTVLFARYLESYFAIFVYHNQVIVQWHRDGETDHRRFQIDHFDGQWLTIYLEVKDDVLIGGFKDMVLDESPSFEVRDFGSINLTEVFTKGTVYVAGSDNKSFDYWSVIADLNMTSSYFDITTDITLGSNSVELAEHGVNMEFLPPLYKIDVNKTTDNFKGCLGEIRVSNLLLPFFTVKQLYPNNHYSEAFFELLSETQQNVGCILCQQTDCFNNGRCVDPEQTYKCECPKGYTADDCSVDIDECEDNNCKNNATCIDEIGRYQCKCLDGFEGDFCEQEIDECESNPCKNGGTCHDGLAEFTCTCTDDYVGKQCEMLKLITCQNNPCKNGSTCTDGKNDHTGNNFTCACTPGMLGIHCDVPYCVDRPCDNGGVCNATATVPYCRCPVGFEGALCEINTNDCILPTGGSPCANGGACVDGIGTFECVCTGTGYTGQYCETDIDECKVIRSACGRGVCTNTPGAYRCACDDPNMCGYRCSLPDPCRPNPCDNGGSCEANCTDTPDYVCHCTGHFGGKNCTDTDVASEQKGSDFNILYVIVPVVVVLVIAAAIGLAVLVNVARSKRATRGTYSPSAQEFCNPRVELDHVLKPPPEERLI